MSSCFFETASSVQGQIKEEKQRNKLSSQKMSARFPYKLTLLGTGGTEEELNGKSLPWVCAVERENKGHREMQLWFGPVSQILPAR